MRKSVFSFNEYHGNYDLDLMSMQISGNLHGSLHDTIFFHETNHWRQQTTTSYGNFLSICRALALNTSNRVFLKLSPEKRKELIESNGTGFLADSLGEGYLLKKHEKYFNAEDIEYINVMIASEYYLRETERLFGTINWIEDYSNRENYLNNLRGGLGILTSSFTPQSHHRIWDMKLDMFINNTRRFLDKYHIGDGEYFEVTDLLEASCIAQEFHMHVIQYDKYLTDYRFSEMLTLSSFQPIKALLHHIGEEASHLNMYKFCGFITIAIEVALNPPIPPRCQFINFAPSIDYVHPSLRFTQILKSLTPDYASKAAEFTSFAHVIDFPVLPPLYGRTTVKSYREDYFKKCKNIYLDFVNDLNNLSRLPIVNWKDKKFLYGEASYQKSLTLLQSAIKYGNDEQNYKQSYQIVRKINSEYPVLSLLILDICYNSTRNGSCVFQNALMLPSLYYKYFESILYDLDANIDFDFDEIVYNIIPIAPLRIYDAAHQHFSENSILGHFSSVAIAQLQAGLSAHFMLFEKEENFICNNFEHDYSDDMNTKIYHYSYIK